jgi:hypothetical protein
MNSLICFPVSCAYGVGQVSPVRVMAFWRILLSFSSCVHLQIMLLIVCSSCSLQGQVEFVIILNLYIYDLFKPWPVTIAVNSSDIGVMVFILSLIDWKNNLLTAPFVGLVHCSCYLVNPISFPSVMIVSLGSLSYTISPVSSVAASLARRSAVFSLNSDVCLHPVKKHCPL